jgi:hypothetical protein
MPPTSAARRGRLCFARNDINTSNGSSLVIAREHGFGAPRSDQAGAGAFQRERDRMGPSCDCALSRTNEGHRGCPAILAMRLRRLSGASRARQDRRSACPSPEWKPILRGSIEGIHPAWSLIRLARVFAQMRFPGRCSTGRKAATLPGLRSILSTSLA